MDKLEHLQLLNRNFAADRPAVAKDNNDISRILLLLLDEVQEAIDDKDDPVLLARELADIGFFLMTAFDIINSDMFEEMIEKSAFNVYRYETTLFDGSLPYGEARVIIKKKKEQNYHEFYGSTPASTE